MFALFRAEGEVRPLVYAVLAPPLVLSQHLLVWVAHIATGRTLIADQLFWIMPLRSLSSAQGLPMWAAGLALIFCLITTWILAVLSLRRARWARTGHTLAAMTFMPGLQIAAVALLATVLRGPDDVPPPKGRFSVTHIVQLAGAATAIIAMLLVTAIAPKPWTAAGSYFLIAMAIVALVQIIGVLTEAIPPFEPPHPVSTPAERSRNLSHIIQGIFAGMAIIVGAVFLSAVTLGAYGWGLFVITPLTVGIATGYIANREIMLPLGRTTPVVLTAAALGSLALIAFSLEGLVCILMASPLGAFVAAIAGKIGRELAATRHGGGAPMASVALLPALFMVEASMPPATPLVTADAIDIAAPPTAVWRALTGDDPIAARPGFIYRAGLAYPIRGELLGQGVGATRIGTFSTGIATERVTLWEPERALAFEVLTQAAAMSEMSPYRHVHAPHVVGYFETGETRFTLKPLASGGTRLTVRSNHVLRIDPIFYWEPMARWAATANVSRVLSDIRAKAQEIARSAAL